MGHFCCRKDILTFWSLALQSGMPSSTKDLDAYESGDGMPKPNPGRSDLTKDEIRFYKRKCKVVKAANVEGTFEKADLYVAKVGEFCVPFWCCLWFRD